ncbi:MAG: amidohydrolase family protein [Balneolaceae bacterium]|nr:amidohydrolase family protein [Balneolaceae bacterium]MDR9408272.1 amidohydrolase family protein [Balneolaceae bacterium]
MNKILLGILQSTKFSMSLTSIYYSLTIFITILFISACQNEQTESAEDNFYTVEDFKTVEKIDAHVHLNVANPIVIEQGIEDNLKMVTLNVESGSDTVAVQQEVALNLQNEYAGRLAYTSAFSLEGFNDSENWQQNTLDYLEQSLENGAIGVKVWKNIGMELRDENGDFVLIDDPQFDPIFQYLNDQNIPLFGHIGEPRNCWLPLEEMTVANDRDYFENNPQYHMYQHPEYPSYEEIIASRNAMLDKNQGLTFFGAHLGSMEWSLEMMSEHLDKYPNMILGMAHRIPHLQYLAQQDREALRDFFIKYQDRFLYSTDLQLYDSSDPEDVRQLAADTWRSDWEFFVTDNTLEVWQVEGSFQGLKLPKEVVDKLYHENARTRIPNLGL